MIRIEEMSVRLGIASTIACGGVATVKIRCLARRKTLSPRGRG